MPEAIVKKVEAQCKAGKRPKMCSADMSCHACGEKVAAVVDAKRKKGQSVAGGSLDGDTDVTHLHGLYSQEDLTYEPLDDGNGIWLRVLDHDAKMIDTVSGKPVQVSQEAIMASLPKWVSPLYPDITANIDHNLGSIKKEFSREEFDFLEAKYEINDGLYLKVQPSDSEIRGALLSKVLRPSPEYDVKEYEDVGDVVRPTGLGLMWEGNPVSEGSGAAAPSTIAVGGDTVTDEDKDKDKDKDTDTGGDDDENLTEEEKLAAAKAAEDAKKDKDKEDKDKDKDKDAEKPSELDELREKFEAQAVEMAEMKTNYEAVLKDNEGQKERHEKYEKAEKAKLAKDLPDEYPVDDVSLEQMRREHLLHTSQMKEIGKKTAKGPDFKETDDMRGEEMTDEEYAEAVKMEAELMGVAEGMSVGAPGASTLQTQNQYRAPK